MGRRAAAGGRELREAGAGGIVRVEGNDLVLEIYQDDFTAPLGQTAQVPETRIDTRSAANLFDLMQPTTSRIENRYADTYIQPEYSALSQFWSANDGIELPATPHIPVDPTLTAQFVKNTADAIENATAQASIDGRMREDPLFWSAYVATAYEPTPIFDGDAPPPFGNVVGPAVTSEQVTLVFMETLFDKAGIAEFQNTFEVAQHRAVVHEVGHQFGLVAPDRGHRDSVENIMFSQVLLVEDPSKFFFATEDVVTLRSRHLSPD